MSNTFVQIVEGSYENADILSSEEFEVWEDAWNRYLVLIKEGDRLEGHRVRLAHDKGGELKVIQETRFHQGQRPSV